MTEFDDWEYYRSSADQLRRGMALLNQYYYDWMGKRYEPDTPLTDAQVELILSVIECFGGVLGFLPMLKPVLPEEKRARLSYVITEKLRQQFEQQKRDHIQAAKNLLEYTYPEIRFQGQPYRPSDWFVSRGFPKLQHPSELEQTNPQGIYETWEARIRLTQHIRDWEERQPPAAPDIPRTLSSPRDITNIQRMAIEAGMATSEVEQLIEWEVSPLTSEERSALAALVIKFSSPLDADLLQAPLHFVWHRLTQEDTRQIGGQKDRLINMVQQRYGYTQERAQKEIDEHVSFASLHYGARMSHRLSPHGLAQEQAQRRLNWQTGELKLFIEACFRDLPRLLIQEPLKVPSGKYDETLTVERLQNDLIAEMGLELSRLPPRTAYVQVLQQHGGVQVVWQGKIETLPLPEPNGQSLEEAIMQRSYETVYRTYEVIEADIRRRQARWRHRGDDGSPPPPTSQTNGRRERKRGRS